MKKLIIFGNTIMAKVIHFYFSRDSNYTVVGFTVDEEYNNKEKMCKLDIFDFETLEQTHSPSSHELFIAIGPSKMNTLREEKFNQAKAKGYELATYISPNAICDSPVGMNCFVGDMVVINPFVKIGDNNFFWENSYVGNDSKIMNHCYISPKSAISTFATVMNNSIIGTSSIINTRIMVAENSLVGAGCYISSNTRKSGVYGRRNAEYLGCISHKINISL